MVNNFYYWHLVSFSADFKLKFRLLPGFEFDKAGDLSHLCALMQIQHCLTLDKE
jgi:hypothetical protein